ncbi:MAG: hypothetical protein U5J64_06175 [Halobacteriales archaeon]|nr:hypothetical protein [Halobacteriales archaeon]
MGDLSVYNGDFVRGSWQTSPHSEFPSEHLTDIHRPETGVTIPEEWVGVRCATTEPCEWDGGSSGEIVYDNDAGRFGEITSTVPLDRCVRTITGITVVLTTKMVGRLNIETVAPRMWQ